MTNGEDTRRGFLKGTSGVLAGLMGAGATPSFAEALPEVNNHYLFDVLEFGAKGDGKTLDTLAINKAIDAAAGAGGGTVYISRVAPIYVSPFV